MQSIFFKALTMTIIVASTMFIGPRSKYKTLILMGLLFSFTGDIFLMVRGNYFYLWFIFLSNHSYLLFVGFSSKCKIQFFKSHDWFYTWAMVYYLSF